MTLPCPCSSRGRRGMSQALQVTALNGAPLPESCHPPGSGGRCVSGKAPPGPQGPVSTGTGTPAPGLTLRHSQLYAIFLVTPIKKQKETKMVFMNSKKDNIFLRRYSMGRGGGGGPGLRRRHHRCPRRPAGGDRCLRRAQACGLILNSEAAWRGRKGRW